MSRRSATASALALAAGVLAVYVLRLDAAAGLIVDDAWYVVLAKALALGDGFRLISSAATQIMPTVPPGFPMILSTVYAVSPQFPENVWLLKSVSIAAMMGVGVVVYVYLITYREMSRSMAAGIAVATILTPALVFLATSTVMAECVFTLGQVLTVLWLERVVRAADARAQRRHALIAGALASATMLVRTVGAATMLAGFAYLIKERAYRSAAAFALIAAVCLTPWTIYSVTHAPTSAEVAEHGGTIAYAYTDLFGMNRPGDAALGTAGAGDFAARVGRNLVSVFGRDMGGVLVPSFFRGADESGQEVVSLGGQTGFVGSSMGSSSVTMALTFALSAGVALGFIGAVGRRATAAELVVALSLAVVLNVPTRTFRYVLPLTPYLLFYFVSGIATTSRQVARLQGRFTSGASSAARIALLCVVGFHVQDHAQYVAMKLWSPVPPDWLGDAREARDVTDWMKAHLTTEGSVASTNPGLVYLLTGRKTVATDDFTRGWPRWKAGGVRWVVALRPLALPSRSLGYRVLYQTSRRKLWVIEIQPGEAGGPGTQVLTPDNYCQRLMTFSVSVRPLSGLSGL